VPGRRRPAPRLSHFDAAGKARMVDVGPKPETARAAAASGFVAMSAATARLIAAGRVEKGDVLGIARTAGLMALKRTAELIPLCHPVRVSAADLALEVVTRGARPGVRIRAEVRGTDRTGFEMEALVAASTAALTVYDMCKSVERGMRITEVRLEEKRGGKSGTWTRSR
jgi:cyclic pyranopterin monophosphate synthase